MYDLCLKVSGDALDLEVLAVLPAIYNLGLLCTDEYYELYHVVLGKIGGPNKASRKSLHTNRRHVMCFVRLAPF